MAFLLSANGIIAAQHISKFADMRIISCAEKDVKSFLLLFVQRGNSKYNSSVINFN
jgi:hypothetical protein